MLAPAMLPSGEKLIRINFPNRLELLFLWVCALPKASRMGLAWRICLSSSPRRPFAVKLKPDPDWLMEVPLACLRKELLRGRPVVGTTVLNALGPDREGDWECEGVAGACASAAIAARYWMTFLVLSVLPAPDSPLVC